MKKKIYSSKNRESRCLVKDLWLAKEIVVTTDTERLVFVQEFDWQEGKKPVRTIKLFRKNAIVWKMDNLEDITAFFYALHKREGFTIIGGNERIDVENYNVVITVPGFIAGRYGGHQWLEIIE